MGLTNPSDLGLRKTWTVFSGYSVYVVLNATKTCIWPQCVQDIFLPPHVHLSLLVHRSIIKVFLQEGRLYGSICNIIYNFSTGRVHENACCCLGKPKRTFVKKMTEKKIMS